MKIFFRSRIFVIGLLVLNSTCSSALSRGVKGCSFITKITNTTNLNGTTKKIDDLLEYLDHIENPKPKVLILGGGVLTPGSSIFDEVNGSNIILSVNNYYNTFRINLPRPEFYSIDYDRGIRDNIYYQAGHSFQGDTRWWMPCCDEKIFFEKVKNTKTLESNTEMMKNFIKNKDHNNFLEKITNKKLNIKADIILYDMGVLHLITPYLDDLKFYIYCNNKNLLFSFSTKEEIFQSLENYVKLIRNIMIDHAASLRKDLGKSDSLFLFPKDDTHSFLSKFAIIHKNLIAKGKLARYHHFYCGDYKNKFIEFVDKYFTKYDVAGNSYISAE